MLSIVSAYTLTPAEYIETPLFTISTRGQEVRRDVTGQTQRAIVVVDAGRIEFQRPAEQRLVVFEGKTITSTSW